MIVKSAENINQLMRETPTAGLATSPKQPVQCETWYRLCVEATSVAIRGSSRLKSLLRTWKRQRNS